MLRKWLVSVLSCLLLNEGSSTYLSIRLKNIRITPSPTPEPACPLSATGVEIFTGTSSQHASIFKGKGDLSQDSGAFGVGIAHNGEILRELLKFPVDSIPPGSTIKCVEIILKTTGPCGPCKGRVDVEMHRVTSGWTT